MKTLAVTVASSSLKHLPGGKVTKKNLKAQYPGKDPSSRVEFVTIPSVIERGGRWLTVEEAIANGVDMIEVRSTNHVNLICAIYLTDGKADVR